MKIGQTIRRIRNEKKLSQRQLAELSGISNTYLSDIEIGRTNPSLKTLNKLAEALEKPLATFFVDSSGAGDQNSSENP